MNLSTKVTLTSGFFLNFAGFAVFSFLAVYLSNTLELSGWETGTILSLLTLSSRVLPLFTGGMGDKYGYKRIMGIGLLLRGVGFVTLAFSHSFSYVSVAVLLIGIGAACYEPSALAFFSQENNPELRKKTFIYLNLALNGGAIIGPLLGGILLVTNPRFPFLLSASIFFILYIVQLIILPKKENTQGSDSNSILAGVPHILKNKRFLLFCFSMIFFWFMFAQLTVALPLHMFAISNNENLVSLVITINALTGLIFMIIFKKLYIKSSAIFLLVVGTLTMALSLLFISFFPSPLWLILCIIGFTVGETLVLPSSDIAIADFVDDQYNGIYYGFSDLSFAVGATLGNFTGTLLLDIYQPNSFVPWVIFSGIGFLGFFLIRTLLLLQRDHEALFQNY
ncbi:MDR family MFS transporter [Cytobacillus oceanisediminis]|uniref:MDR family MFS transporter n=1 Tax=Cytobacillus oceanisediminis TaxID=665099 RepID=UPI001FB1A914|nr:MFS transporter [Cytobacillus oceanisediminis]UOE53482.1 MFS transporter [Cytobacillus oceanisediminis]